MSFDLTQLMDSSDMKAEYVSTAYMFDVSDTAMGLLLTQEVMGTDTVIPEASAIAVATSPLEESRVRMQTQRERYAKERAELGLGPTDEEKRRMAGSSSPYSRPAGEY